MIRVRKKQQGVALVAAIFLIVILALLGVYMVTISGVQHATTSRAALSSRVYFGAKSGLEWGIHQAIGASSCLAGPTAFDPAGEGLNGISVTVICTPTAPSVFYLTSTAEFGLYGSADYVRRRLEATVAP
ncbi:MAG: hypothetical protein A2140_05680 [Candidatus Muproteobacteria bacterium RBG_16_62_13]|uniref:Pilus assembly protein MshP n=1 Tax=Candidatus Muproteobacteria bacterium RBG_16_62_13 TaxID=1817756 RepID=A0A1F6T7J0_9PROT|nr:MAG: hypothetical protein A2140_05680 [Candidatus Muproteobacteria bacterium RBG_16_62_13]